MIDPICLPCPEVKPVVLVEKLPDLLCEPCPVPEERPSLLPVERIETIITNKYPEVMQKIMREFDCPIDPGTAPYTAPQILGKAPRGQYNVPYNYKFHANYGEGDYAFEIDGALPQGLTFNPATGRISGNPGEIGLFPFRVGVRDTRGRGNFMQANIEIVE